MSMLDLLFFDGIIIMSLRLPSIAMRICRGLPLSLLSVNSHLTIAIFTKEKMRSLLEFLGSFLLYFAFQFPEQLLKWKYVGYEFYFGRKKTKLISCLHLSLKKYLNLITLSKCIIFLF